MSGYPNRHSTMHPFNGSQSARQGPSSTPSFARYSAFSDRPFVAPPLSAVSSSTFSESQRSANRLPPSSDSNVSFFDCENSGCSGLPYRNGTPSRSLSSSQKTQGGNEAASVGQEEDLHSKGKKAVQTVLDYPFYTALWKNRQVDENGNGVVYEEALKQCQETSPDALLHSLIRECVKLKKLCRLISARVLFLELLCKYCDDKLAWREFIRMEFELGECRNAQFLLQCALDLFPQDLSFKIKQVRVNERLQDEEELLRMVQAVTQKQSSKFSRILMNCLLSLGRLGNPKALAELERLVFSAPYCTFLETYEFFYYYVNAFSCTFMLSVITQLIRKKVKKDCFLVYSHEYVEWLFLNIDAAEGQQSKYAKIYHQLLPLGQKSSPEKGHWEVFLSRMQYRTRIILLIYAKALQEVCVGRESDRIERMGEAALCPRQRAVSETQTRNAGVSSPVSRRLEVDSVSQHQQNPLHSGLSLQIPIRIILSKLSHSQALQFCMKPKHSSYSTVLINLARMEFFRYHIAESIFILRYAILHFVDEWKFGIELSNFLVITNRQLEAFLLCKNLLKLQIGAGRLWTLFIHIVHEYAISTCPQ